jgi:hypothetical protein
MDANEREKIGIIRGLRAGTESSGGTKILIAAKDRKVHKEIKISADYADFGSERMSVACDSGARPRVSGLRVSL